MRDDFELVEEPNLEEDLNYFRPPVEEVPYGTAYQPKSRYQRDGKHILKPKGDDKRAD